MSKLIIDDAQSAYNAWREAQQGSYVERVLADSIVRDIVPPSSTPRSRSPYRSATGLNTNCQAAHEGS